MYPFCGVCKLWEVPLLRSVNRCHSDLEHGSSTSMAETTQFAAIILPVQNASCRLFLGNFEVSNLNTHLCKNLTWALLEKAVQSLKDLKHEEPMTS